MKIICTQKQKDRILSNSCVIDLGTSFPMCDERGCETCFKVSGIEFEIVEEKL